MKFICALSGALGTCARAVKGWIKAKQAGENTDYKMLGITLIQAVVIGIIGGYVVPDPYTALLYGWIGGKFADEVGLQFKKIE